MTETAFLGTDVLLYFLTRSDPERAEQCRALLMRAANGVLLLEVPTLSIVEVVEALEAGYPRDVIASKLPGLLRIPGLLVHEREIHLRALELYGRHAITYRMALNLAHVLAADSPRIYTYEELPELEAPLLKQEP